jgi:hypothetical protein
MAMAASAARMSPVAPCWPVGGPDDSVSTTLQAQEQCPGDGLDALYGRTIFSHPGVNDTMRKLLNSFVKLQIMLCGTSIYTGSEPILLLKN